MKIKGKKISKRTLALFAAMLVALSGGLIGTQAKLSIFSDFYIADFQLDHLQVHLIENGDDVCHGENEMTSVHRYDSGEARDQKYHGNLVEYLGYTNETHKGDTPAYKLGTPGTIEPGRTYKEEISARNGQNIDQYVRLTMKKYWVEKDPETGEMKKATYLDPDLIKLTYNGKAYNKGAWQRNEKEHSAESDTYYLTNMLKGSKGKKKSDSPLLFNELTIDKSIVDQITPSEPSSTSEETTTTDDGEKVTVYTYTYDYDSYTFYIEASVQAIQTHNVNDAIDSLWGVSNVSAKNGKVTVK